MAEHAKFAPSDAARWLACPGAVNASVDVERVDSFYSLEGTLAHELLARCIRNKLPAVHFIGHQLILPRPDLEFDGKVPDDMAEVIDDCLKHVQDRWHCADDMELFVEVRVDPEIPGCWGTADLLFASKSMHYVGVWDLKYGKGIQVEVNDNPQTMTYLCGGIKFILERWSAANGGHTILWDDLEFVEHVIMQPRGYHPEGKVRNQRVNIEDLREFHRKAKAAVELANDPAAPRIPGEKQCQWCPVKASCPAVAKQAFDVTKLANSPPAGGLDDVTLKYVLDNRQIVRDFLDEVESAHIQSCMDGQEGLGYKVTAGPSRRVWDRAMDEVAVELKPLRLKKDEMYETKLRSPTQIEKVLKARAKAGKTIKWDTFNAVVFKPEGKPRLVREDAPGAPIIKSADALFDEAEQDENDLAALLN